MLKNFSWILSAALAAQMFVSAAQAGLTFSLTSNEGAIPGANNFSVDLTGLSLTQILNGKLTASSSGQVLFYYHGSESGYSNSFTARNQDNSVAVSYTENTNFDAWNPGGSFLGSLNVNAGDILKLEFNSNVGPVHAINTAQFGIFAQSGGSVFANNGRIYFGHDDGGAGPDDNHDDMMISAVFIPEAGSLAMWVGLLGLGTVRLRRARKQA